jgi:hypothetical protein
MASDKKYKVKTDPELLRQIDSVALSEDNEKKIQAVFTLSLPIKKLLNPEVVINKANEIVQKVSSEVGENPSDINIFENLGSFIVSAKPEFIRIMLNQSGISAAVANKQPKGSLKL